MKKNLPRFLTFTSLLLFALFINKYAQQSYSASLASTSVTLSNARLSFKGKLAAGNVVGTTLATINTTVGAAPSTDSAQLVEGDGLAIGEAGSLGTYAVASTSSNAIINLATPPGALVAGDADAGDDVISTQSATLTVRFTSASAVNGGKFRVLVPAETTNTTAADGIPDAGKWDYGTTAPTVTCPTGPNYTFGSVVQSASSVTLNGQDYHSFVCPYTGTGTAGTALTMTIDSLINPAPKSDHIKGTADTYNIVVQQLDSADVVVDATSTAVGVIEAVKITASVPAQITFRILGVASGTALCGTTTTVTTTPASVPFGEIAIDAFSVAAHGLAVSTNAANGYAVTAIENDQLGRNGAACAGVNGTGVNTCIPDAEVASMDFETTQAWASTANKGFGFTLHDLNSTTLEDFSYATGYRHFADEADLETAEQIFSNTSVADNQNLFVCYKVVVAPTTAAGNYENYVRYTATATF